MAKEPAFGAALARERDFDDEVIAACRARVEADRLRKPQPGASGAEQHNHELVVAASAFLLKVRVWAGVTI